MVIGGMLGTCRQMRRVIFQTTTSRQLMLLSSMSEFACLQLIYEVCLVLYVKDVQCVYCILPMALRYGL